MRPRDTYMFHSTGSSLECWFIVNWTLGNKLHWNFIQNSKHFHWRKCIWKCRLHNSLHFASASIYWLKKCGTLDDMKWKCILISRDGWNMCFKQWKIVEITCFNMAIRKQNTVKCRYNAVQFITILHTTLRCNLSWYYIRHCDNNGIKWNRI